MNMLKELVGLRSTLLVNLTVTGLKFGPDSVSIGRGFHLEISVGSSCLVLSSVISVHIRILRMTI
jgi:hypothetical protein